MAPPKHNKYPQTHGLCHTPEYAIWNQARLRCEDPNNKAYDYYGGRGIRMYPPWVKSFPLFYAEVGQRPSPKHTLDREKNDKGYEPGNCRWVTRDVQMNNTRRNVVITIGDQSLTVKQWADKMGVRPGMFYLRLRKGWDPIIAITKPRLSREEHSVLARAAAASRWRKYKLLRINPATEAE